MTPLEYQSNNKDSQSQSKYSPKSFLQGRFLKYILVIDLSALSNWQSMFAFLYKVITFKVYQIAKKKNCKCTERTFFTFLRIKKKANAIVTFTFLAIYVGFFLLNYVKKFGRFFKAFTISTKVEKEMLSSLSVGADKAVKIRRLSYFTFLIRILFQENLRNDRKIREIIMHFSSF